MSTQFSVPTLPIQFEIVEENQVQSLEQPPAAIMMEESGKNENETKEQKEKERLDQLEKNAKAFSEGKNRMIQDSKARNRKTCALICLSCPCWCPCALSRSIVSCFCRP